MGSLLDLYKRHFVDKSDERMGLLELAAREFDLSSGRDPAVSATSTM